MDTPIKPDSSDPAKLSATQRKRPINQRFRFWLLILLIAAICSGYRVWTTWSANMGRGKIASPVVSGEVTTANVPVYLTALGSVIPTYSVTVKTQINGTLTQVLYREGQMVKAGDQLAQIDPRIYEAQLVEYQGQLLRDQALLENALVDLKRYKVLYKQDSTSQQTLATQESLVKQYQGTVQLDQGLIDSTKVNLIYCKITAPVDGRIGLRLVDPGNYVQTSDTNGIAVINTLNPITVIFTIAEDSIQDVLQKIYAHDALQVEVYDRQQNKLLASGQLLTIDNQIDSTTGTVKLRAEFANDQNILFPSQFVNVKLLVKTLIDAVIVPTAAIQFTDKGSFVYLLKDKTPKTSVKVQPVTTSITMDDKTVITQGLTPGQQVVVEGADNLLDGSKVTVGTGHLTA